MKKLIRWGAYPIVFGATAIIQVAIASMGWPYWPLAPLTAGLGIALVALLERYQPYEPRWNHDHNDTMPDICHAVFSLALIFGSLQIASYLRLFLPVEPIWPSTSPMWLDVLMAGIIVDFGLWFMHWLSHKNKLLWRLHALHHSSERLYWLNGERRHPLSAILLASPGVAIAVVLGAPPEAIGCWFSIIAVHLAFQHANLDYSVGVFRNLIGVAEVHRWHHKRDYEDAEVNFGEFWIIWDRIFGTFRYQINGVRAGEVGIRASMPTGYFSQLIWPFRKGNG